MIVCTVTRGTSGVTVVFAGMTEHTHSWTLLCTNLFHVVLSQLSHTLKRRNKCVLALLSAPEPQLASGGIYLSVQQLTMPDDGFYIVSNSDAG